MTFETLDIPIKFLKRNTGQIPGVPKNPRIIKDNNFKKLQQSIEEDPDMLQLREILVYQYNGENVIIGGNMRFEALKALKYESATVKLITDALNEATAAKLKRIILKDNSAYGEWDFDELANEWDEQMLIASAIDLPALADFQTDEEKEAEDADARDNAAEERQRDPDSEIIVAVVSLFGTTEDMLLTQALTADETEKLIALAKKEGAGNLFKRLIAQL